MVSHLLGLSKRFERNEHTTKTIMSSVFWRSTFVWSCFWFYHSIKVAPQTASFFSVQRRRMMHTFWPLESGFVLTHPIDCDWSNHPGFSQSEATYLNKKWFQNLTLEHTCARSYLKELTVRFTSLTKRVVKVKGDAPTTFWNLPMK